MEDVRALAIVVGNLGGVGFLAWSLLKLHEKALATFREELGAERVATAQWVAAERSERSATINTDRIERASYHDRVITAIQQGRDDGRTYHAAICAHLKQIEDEVRDVREALEAKKT